jgi:hypothetical protein
LIVLFLFLIAFFRLSCVFHSDDLSISLYPNGILAQKRMHQQSIILPWDHSVGTRSAQSWAPPERHGFVRR